MLEMRDGRSDSTASAAGWTELEKEQIHELWEDGNTMQQIAEGMGVMWKPKPVVSDDLDIKRRGTANAVANVTAAHEFLNMIVDVRSDGRSEKWTLKSFVNTDDARNKRLVADTMANIHAATALLHLTMKMTGELSD